MTTLVYVLAAFATVLGLAVLFVAFRYYRAKDLGASLDLKDDDEDGPEEDDPELHFGNLHLVDRDGEPLESGEQPSSGYKVLDFDDFLNPDLLDDEDDEDDDNDLLAETLVRIATIEDYDGFVNDMLEKTSKIMKHITSIQVALKREEDEDNANLFIVLRHHLQQQMQDYHDIVETVNKYVGRNEDYIDAVVAIEEEIAEVEGYNL
jgi:hypothetical protein